MAPAFIAAFLDRLAQAAPPAPPVVDPGPPDLTPSVVLRRVRRERLRYDGARADHLTRSWSAGGGDAASEIGPDLPRLRARAREAERNRGIAARALQVLELGVVGVVGPTPRFLTGSDTLDERFARAWKAWAKQAAASDRWTFAGLCAQALRSMARDGEALGRIRPRRLEDGLPVPVQLELLESDHLDTSKTQELGGARIVNGVETNAIGAVVAYWMHRRHPGDVIASGVYESVRVPAESVVHVYWATRAGQRRGVSWLAPVLDAIWHHTELRRSERVRFRASASMFATVEGTTDDPDDDGIAPLEASDGQEAGRSGYVEDADRNPVNEIKPGLIANVTHGKKLTLHNPQAAIGYADVIRVEERDIARGLGVMYEAISGDLSMVNWASYRVGDVRFRQFVDFIRAQIMEPLFLDPILTAWLGYAQAAGVLPALPQGATVEWRWPPHEEMDREASARADTAEMASGLVSFEQRCEQRGQTMAEQIRSLGRSRDALREAGLRLAWEPPDTGA